MAVAETITNSLSPTPDTNSPYYFHPDFLQLSSSIFSTEKLSEAEDNYVLWKLRFLDILRSTNKIGFIDGTLPKPDPSSQLYQPWKQCNAFVMCLLDNSMSEKLGKSVLYSQTAHKAWESLRRRFVPCVDSKIYELRQRLATLRQDGDSVSKYIGKFSKAWFELSEYDPVPVCKCGGCSCKSTKRAMEAREKEQRYAFLMGLNEDFDYVRMKIMFKNTPPSLDQAYAMVEQAESMMNWNRR